MGEFRITEQTEAAALAGSEQLPVAQLSSTVFRTGTTISASSVGNVLYDSANGWLTAGFAGNQQVNVSGWTGGSVANNLDSATIVSVTANALYLDVALTSASAGDTVTVRRWMPRKVSLAGRLKTYFDTLYQAVGTYLTPGAITTSGLTMAADRLLGRSTASTGAVEEITVGSGLSLSGGTLSANAVDASAVTYAPADNTDWTGSTDPGDVDQALDQLAQRVKDVETASSADTSGSPITYTIDTGSTADSDPGAGLLKFDNATQSAATMLYIDNDTADAAVLTTYFASLGQSGFLSLVQSDDPSVWRVYKITAVTAASGYYKLTVVNQAGVGSFADNALVRLAFDSDAAATGLVTGPGSSTDNTLPRFDGTGGATLQGSGVIVDDDNKISGYRGNINTQTGTSYSLDAADTGKIVELSNASAIALTLPATAVVGFACTLVQAGAGQVTFAAGGSGSLRNRQSHTKLAGQWAMASAYVRANSGGSAAEWVVSGDTTT